VRCLIDDAGDAAARQRTDDGGTRGGELRWRPDRRGTDERAQSAEAGAGVTLIETPLSP
jgi:hypothetical protein